MAKDELKIRYSCNCKSKDVLASELPDWPWIPSSALVCMKCKLTIRVDIIGDSSEKMILEK